MRTAKAALLVAVLLTASMSGAQTQPTGWQFDAVSVSAGQDALSSGITGSVWLLHEEKRTIVNVTVQQEQAWVIYGKRLSWGKLSSDLGISGGHFMGVPWIGPYATAALPLGKVAGQNVSVSTMQWPVLNAWEPDRWKNDGVKNPESLNLGFLTSYQVTVGPVGVSYALLNFLDDPWNALLGVSYTQKVRDDFAISGSVTSNSNAKKWMFCIGVTWNP